MHAGDYFGGLDVHSQRTSFCVQRKDGPTVREGVIPTTFEGLRRFQEEHQLPPGTRVGLETGTVAFFVARHLQRLGLTPVVIDAHEVRLKALRPYQKCDRRDAFEICDGLRRDIYRSIVHVPPLSISQLRDTLSRRRHFVRCRTNETNAAKRLLRAAGLREDARRTLGTEKSWSLLVHTLESEEPLASYLRLHQQAWQGAFQAVADLDRQLDQQRQAWQKEVDLLQTFPAVGPITALTTVAVFSDVSRFPSPKHAASYAGLVPSTFQSGDRDTHGHITRRGSAELRSMLCEVAHHTRVPSHPLHPYFRLLAARHGYKKAVIAVANRICRILFALLRDQQPFCFDKLNVEKGLFEKKVVYTYRLKKPQATQRI